MKNSRKILIGSVLAAVIVCAGSSIGSSNIRIYDTLRIIIEKILPISLTEGIEPRDVSIVWLLRLPRVLLAFIVGGSLAMSGAVIQSVLKNHLATPYILGVSSGATLGSALIMLTGFAIPLVGGLTMPVAGFLFGLLTVYIVVSFSSKLDKTMSNNTIILFGMVFTLFISALLTTLMALYREELKSLITWQMGSFALKGWSYVRVMLPFFIIGTLGIIRYTKEMDILTFGEDQAKSVGVETEKVRKHLFVFSTILTGAAVSLSGTIGFVDLIAPHMARKIVGSNHRYVIPMSFILGGSLMVVADLIARTIVSPSELPVGAITALVGAPFFAWVYFGKR
ncbi:FecCD family ABC transporter permease [Treponema primitia]|uniref:FecCD family ABC transporter permease n=1 Tax=Treponema primitia TaxID=88058 RepID=UPI0002554F69|nr:iron ABC transporter permease [Treponema primitia]